MPACIRTDTHRLPTYIALHYTALHCITLHYIALHYITLHYTTLHHITLHDITLHYNALHCITLVAYIPYIYMNTYTYNPFIPLVKVRLTIKTSWPKSKFF